MKYGDVPQGIILTHSAHPQYIIFKKTC